MTDLLSKERLEEIAELARKENYNPCRIHSENLATKCDSEVIEAMASELIQRREAAQNPVAWMWERATTHWECNGKYGGWEWVTSRKKPDVPENDRSRRNLTALYDAPSFNASNKALIAAAPDLLEALEAVVRVADRDTVEFNMARAAIAKAKGES